MAWLEYKPLFFSTAFKLSIQGKRFGQTHISDAEIAAAQNKMLNSCCCCCCLCWCSCSCCFCCSKECMQIRIYFCHIVIVEKKTALYQIKGVQTLKKSCFYKHQCFIIINFFKLSR